MSYTYITYVPRVSSFYFSEAINNQLNVLDQADFQHQILPWQQRVLYLAKSLMEDTVTIMAHTQYDISGGIVHPPGLYVCDNYQNEITAIDLNLIAPYYKGSQAIPGNNYTNPMTGTVTPLLTTLWVFKWSDFAPYLTPDTPLSIYYLRLDNLDNTGTPYSYYSEPILLNSSKKDIWGQETGHRNTKLFIPTYNTNRSQNTNIVADGWYSDFPIYSIPYNLQFNIRCEAFVLPLDPKVINIGYLQQLYEQQFISGQQIPLRTLKIGELCPGVPEYMLQMITEALLADKLYIGDSADKVYQYKVWNPSGQTAPGDMWKTQREEVLPLIRSATILTLGSLMQQFMVTPVPVLPTRIHDGVFDAAFD